MRQADLRIFAALAKKHSHVANGLYQVGSGALTDDFDHIAFVITLHAGNTDFDEFVMLQGKLNLGHNRFGQAVLTKQHDRREIMG